MPFADKFRAMMDMPLPGDKLGEMTVESITVGHEGRADGHYAYPVRVVLHGPGGQAAVRRAIKPLLARRCTTFSGFGTPYQLWFGRPAIESLGDARYSVSVEGAGMRAHLGSDLARFCEHLASKGLLDVAPAQHEALVAGYIDGYQGDVRRLVGRYRTRLRRSERG
jgi:hypothetical protein